MGKALFDPKCYIGNSIEPDQFDKYFTVAGNNDYEYICPIVRVPHYSLELIATISRRNKLAKLTLKKENRLQSWGKQEEVTPDEKKYAADVAGVCFPAEKPMKAKQYYKRPDGRPTDEAIQADIQRQMLVAAENNNKMAFQRLLPSVLPSEAYFFIRAFSIGREWFEAVIDKSGLEIGTDIDLNYILSSAAAFRDPELMLLLISRGAKVNAQTKDYVSAVQSLVRSWECEDETSEEVAHILIANGAKVFNVQTRNSLAYKIYKYGSESLIHQLEESNCEGLPLPEWNANLRSCKSQVEFENEPLPIIDDRPMYREPDRPISLRPLTSKHDDWY